MDVHELFFLVPRGIKCAMFRYLDFTVLRVIFILMTCPLASGDVNTECGGGRDMIRTTRIVGGATAPPGAWPWMVSLRHLTSGGRFKHHCGASLISRQWAVTAAHCFDVSKESLQWRVHFGAENNRRRATLPDSRTADPDSYVTLLITHPLFNSSSHGNDIALVRLATPPSHSEATPICLPALGQDVVGTGIGCYVTGWGDTRGTGREGTLQQVQVPVIDKEVCSAWYKEQITEDTFCAGYSLGVKDACKGDSGGPYACPHDGVWVLGGVVSWGKDCGATHQPGVYTDVEHHLPWIYDVIATYEPVLATFGL